MSENWKAIEPYSEISVWSNIENDAIVGIKRIEKPLKTYFVEFMINQKTASKKLNSLSECRKFSTEWMNNNPVPDESSYKELFSKHQAQKNIIK